MGLIQVTTFAISDTLAALAGVIVASKVANGQANSGVGIELTAIAAVVIGGTSILGGRGAVWHSVAGVLLLAMIGNGFNIMNISSTFQSLFWGLIILFAVGLDAVARRREG